MNKDNIQRIDILTGDSQAGLRELKMKLVAEKLERMADSFHQSSAEFREKISKLAICPHCGGEVNCWS